MITEAVVLAGGFGTRLKTVVSDVPKPMAPVNGSPFLHYLLEYIAAAGIKRIVLSTGYMAEKVRDHFGSNFCNMDIAYCEEKTPLGTGGGIRLALEQCHTQTVLVLNGDSFFAVPLEEYFKAHQHSDAVASLALRPVDDGARYGTITLEDNRITAFREKTEEVKGSALINGGVYLLNREFYLANTPAGVAFSIEYDFFAKKAAEAHLHGFVSSGYFIDIGIPEDYARAQLELGVSE
ncbi:MAG: nucleotidyltransferase family protein [Bacteroidia bacterium]|jgi:D-glycero-alpha-D-manno-heptose 1-phosphate guanylyltransferase|nr:nucleotidyltransferase family protein [Bacteroidia bacterium]